MKVSLNWLRELVELPPTTDELVSLLTMAGVEVEGIARTGCDIPKVVVAEIKESVQHPNADRLSVCTVDDGSGTPRQIVCGAKNYKVGDKVPLALPGATLPGDYTIKAGKLRGVESNGMLCSAKELELAEDAEGLLILPQSAKVAQPIGDLFPGDTVLDLEVTPNRADLLSYNGIARELGALTNKTARAAAAKKHDGRQGASLVEIESAECPAYSLTIVKGVKVGPSPAWLRSRLESVGLRSINNVVDVTNYVMLEMGQPLHAFDASKVDRGIVVRQAGDAEKVIALDGKEYPLNARNLVIADKGKILAIAGVMGGEHSGVGEDTSEVWLESALFDAKSIRRTSRQLGLSSDSSYRFERGVDPTMYDRAASRAAELIVEVAGGTSEPVFIFTSKAPVTLPHLNGESVPLRLSRIGHVLGVAVPEERVNQILPSLGLSKTDAGWLVPSSRPDLTREVDLIEEIARVVGMDEIPARTQATFAPASATDRNYDRAMALRRALVAQGLHEARSVTLTPAQPLGLGAVQVDPANMLRVKNPMIEEQVTLRPNLLHGLLIAVRDNLRAGTKSVRLFEVGRTFHTQRPEEYSHAAIVLSGPLGERTWRAGEARNSDVFDLKGILASVLGAGATFEGEKNPALALSFSVKMNGKPVGLAGQLWPAEARALDAESPIVFAELDLGALAKAEQGGAKKYRDIPRFPAVTRDIAMLAPLTLAHAQVADSLAKANEPLLAGVELFDVFTDSTGTKIPADKKSLAYSLTYRSPERTLTADEVNAAHAKLKERLKPLGVTLRE